MLKRRRTPSVKQLGNIFLSKEEEENAKALKQLEHKKRKLVQLEKQIAIKTLELTERQEALKEREVCLAKASSERDILTYDEIILPLVFPCKCAARYSPASLITLLQRSRQNYSRFEKMVFNAVVHGISYNPIDFEWEPLKCLGCQQTTMIDETTDLLLSPQEYLKLAQRALNCKEKADIELVLDDRHTVSLHPDDPDNFQRVRMLPGKPMELYLTCPFKCGDMKGHTMKDLTDHIFFCRQMPAFKCPCCPKTLPNIRGHFSTWTQRQISPFVSHIDPRGRPPLDFLLATELAAHLPKCMGKILCPYGHPMTVKYALLGATPTNPEADHLYQCTRRVASGSPIQFTPPLRYTGELRPHTHSRYIVSHLAFISYLCSLFPDA